MSHEFEDWEWPFVASYANLTVSGDCLLHRSMKFTLTDMQYVVCSLTTDGEVTSADDCTGVSLQYCRASSHQLRETMSTVKVNTLHAYLYWLNSR